MKSQTNNITKNKIKHPLKPLVLFLLMLISLANLLYFKSEDNIFLLRVFKATTSILFVSIAIASYKHNNHKYNYFYLMLIGFVFAFFGDVFLSISNEGIFFILGLGCFSLAHVLYTLTFCKLLKISLNDAIIASIIAILLICVEVFKDGFDFGNVFPLLVFYTLLISIMVSKAISLLRLRKGNSLPIALIIIGAILFIISDFILLFVYYYEREFAFLPYLNLVVYYLGQGFLAFSLIKEIKVTKT